MHCLKCGTEIQPPNVFCQNCLAEMKQYPVARDTPVVIQPRPAENPERRTRRAWTSNSSGFGGRRVRRPGFSAGRG